MATRPVDLNSRKTGFMLRRYLPFMDWLFHYQRANLPGDLIAGVIVAVMLVPQGMAYALLAGLPPEVGLYVSIIPLMIYGLLGSSGFLSVGPTALVSLLVATGINSLNPANVAEYLQIALILALQVGIIQLLMGLLRAGFIVNFLSHPVLSGFTSAAAIIIGVSQLKHILGLDLPRAEYFYETLLAAVQQIGDLNVTTTLISVVSIGVLLYFKRGLGAYLKHLGVAEQLVVALTKTGPLVLVVMGTLLVYAFNLHETADIAIVGAVPGGLPPLTMPNFDLSLWGELLPIAITISLIGFMESISVTKSLASRKRQKIDADQELIGLGAANLGAAFTGGYPVTGGLSRTVVNYTAGANTGLASIITAGLIAVTVLFLTPLFYYLPQAVLAAIIIVAVSTLFDFNAFKRAWHYNKIDGLSLVVTFIAVLFTGIETGILIGVATSIGLYLYRTSRPHTAIIGRIPDSEHFRNVLRHDVQTHPKVLLVRVDESLYFTNAAYLEQHLLDLIVDHPQVEQLVLVCSAVNFIDSSALEVLEKLLHELHNAGVQFNMAEVKGPVMDQLRKVNFDDAVGQAHIFLSTHQAMIALCNKVDTY